MDKALALEEYTIRVYTNYIELERDCDQCPTIIMEDTFEECLDEVKRIIMRNAEESD